MKVNILAAILLAVYLAVDSAPSTKLYFLLKVLYNVRRTGDENRLSSMIGCCFDGLPNCQN